MKDSTYIILGSMVSLSVLIALVPDPTIRAALAGGLLGLVGGHLNGAQSPAQGINTPTPKDAP